MKKPVRASREKSAKPPNLSDAPPAATAAVAETSQAGAPEDFPIVGIGASAGGLKAFEEFFSGIPADAEMNMAFVLVQHLAPDHKSILCELIQRYTRMQVLEVADGMVVKINTIYILSLIHI